MEEQRRRSRGGGTAAEQGEDLAERVAAVARESDASEFVGWNETAMDTRIIAIEELGDGTALLKLEQSPFYPEGGGQVSDIGEIVADHGRATVIDAFRLGADQVLRVRLEEGELPVDSEVWAAVDAPRRRLTRSNHTATHVLNWALRQTLGDGVRQAGLVRGPRQAALRLHPPRAGGARDAERDRAHGQRARRRGPAGHLGDRRPPGGGRRRRHRPVRGEVRRARARGLAPATSPRSCAAAPTSRAPARSGPSRSCPRPRPGPGRGASRPSPAPRRWSSCASASASSPRSSPDATSASGRWRPTSSAPARAAPT